LQYFKSLIKYKTYYKNNSVVIKTSIIISLIFLTLFCQAQSNDNLKIEAGKNGSIYTLCSFNGVLTFSNGDSIGDFNSNVPNLYLSKMDSSGNILWINRLKGGSSYLIGYGAPGIGICTDKFDNVYITGTFLDTLKLNITTTIISTNSRAAFIAKYSPSGTLIWVKQPNGIAQSAGIDISSDSNGNVYATGQYSNGSISFGNLTPIVYQGASPTIHYDDIYIVKMDSLGSAKWINGIHGGFNKHVNSIIASAAGAAYISGRSFGSGTMIAGSNNISVNKDSYIAKYNSLGSEEWIKKATCGYGDNYFEDLTLDTKGHIFGNGQFQVQEDFGTGTASQLTTSSSGNATDLFLVKYDTTGTDIWAKQAASNNTTFSGGRGMGITIDSTGKNIFMIGQGQVDAKFNPLSSLIFTTDEAYLVKLDTNGQGLCQIKLIQFDLVEDLTIDQTGNVYVIGTGGIDPNNYIRITKIRNDCSLSWSKSIKQRVFTLPLGLTKIDSKPSLDIYPNPTKNTLNINTSANVWVNQLNIFDLNGKTVLSSANQTTIDVSKLNAGLYFIKIKTDQGEFSRKFIKE
jgi:hypothetical protein